LFLPLKLEILLYLRSVFQTDYYENKNQLAYFAVYGLGLKLFPGCCSCHA
jgi:hypothetical protein